MMADAVIFWTARPPAESPRYRETKKSCQAKSSSADGFVRDQEQDQQWLSRERVKLANTEQGGLETARGFRD